ncbi:ethanolamine ammonia-lyase subunit EutC [Vibrio rhizosphaerae]|uniref:Ethanolamine ammonia-lyase small subunit n=1 Tax=Vibrio rhizosphaerae TaxID=398736 RepID=A0ABU4IXP5_9VIBR|nr:ethanolamine ammonia-lyase subunit EutC [Vibrio rhizosphaerae]MDW6094175.1 ethanolamine ammonia-lyase subunit EutC [Vibrio rhizosphaerae]
MNSNPLSKHFSAGDDVAETYVHHDPWEKLRQFTHARIGIGRAGTSIPTQALLQFQLSHAQAIDAVHVPLDVPALCHQFEAEPLFSSYLPAFRLHSQAQHRMAYLQRPDYGRCLNEAAIYQLQQYQQPEAGFDLAIVIADGLSSYAITHHAAPFLTHLLHQLHDDPNQNWQIAPLCIVEQGRVAVGDDVGAALNAREVLVLIGERPGLSSPDSMGLYLTWHPHRGTEDSLRNCISNVRPEGLDYQQAAHKCFYLLQESRRLHQTGVGLKDRSEDKTLHHTGTTPTFSLVDRAK